MAVLTKITQRSLADNAVSAAKIQADTIVAGDIAPNSVTASELADDAVDTAAIADDAVTNASIADGAIDTAAKLGSNVVTDAKIATNAVTSAKINADAVTNAKVADGAIDTTAKLGSNVVTSAKVADGAISTSAKLADNIVSASKMTVDTLTVEPHIIPGTLYPAYKGLMANGVRPIDSTTGPAGSTITASMWGTVQADGRMYYYTDIPESGPMKDPRIGAKYGSTRYKTHALQSMDSSKFGGSLIEASSGHVRSGGGNGPDDNGRLLNRIFKVDGRDWMRAYGSWSDHHEADGVGERICSNAAAGGQHNFLEITAYFSDFNILADFWSNSATNVQLWIDGEQVRTDIQLKGSHNHPWLARMNEAFANFPATPHVKWPLGVHTIKLGLTSTYYYVSGVDLIVQEWGATTGSDLAPNNSATSAGSLTEADATAGWTDNGNASFASDNTPASAPTGAGNHSLHFTTNSSGDTVKLANITVAERSTYKVKITYKQISATATSNPRVLLGSSDGGTQYGNIHFNNKGDGMWHTKEWYVVPSTTSLYVAFGTGNGNTELYIGSVEIFLLSTGKRSEIQIQPQNVVSYNKRFAVSAASHHYNPFRYAADGTTAINVGDNTAHGKVTGGWSGTGATFYDSTLDTGTSLGLSNWENGGNYYRPVNGGRVVKWIDSTGALKTSVTVMPPSGFSHALNASSNAGPHQSPWTTQKYGIYSSTTENNDLQEIAVTLNGSQFGNGAANGGSNPAGSQFADMSCLTGTADNFSYCMDDNATLVYANAWSFSESTYPYFNRASPGSDLTLFFIGTGFKMNTMSQGNQHVFGNSHYGSHSFQIWLDRSNGDNGYWRVDNSAAAQAVKQHNSGGGTNAIYNWNPSAHDAFTIMQPKRPPIPPEAVVLADYMLMADSNGYQADTNGTSGGAERMTAPKGSIRIQCNNEIYVQGASSAAAWQNSDGGGTDCMNYSLGASRLSNMGNGAEMTLNKFCTYQTHYGWDIASRHQPFYVGGKLETTTKHGTSGSSYYKVPNGTHAPGLFNWQAKGNHAASSGYFEGADIHTPIHSATHYVPYETRTRKIFLGGREGIEDTHLICSPEGKSWADVTTDYSTIRTSRRVYSGAWTGSELNTLQGNRHRIVLGTQSEYRKCSMKDWAPLGNHWWQCLEDGDWVVTFLTHINTSVNTGGWWEMKLNNVNVAQLYGEDTDYNRMHIQASFHATRGDLLWIHGTVSSASHWQIDRL